MKLQSKFKLHRIIESKLHRIKIEKKNKNTDEMDSKIDYSRDGSGRLFCGLGLGRSGCWKLSSGRAGLIEKCCEAGLLFFSK